MKQFKQTLTLLTLLLSFVFTPVWAIGLDDAKQQGLVGEQLNGYLGVIKSSSGAKQLVDSINQKRRAAYASKAKKAGVGIEIIETRIGQRLIQRAKPGQYIQDSGGRWTKK